MELSYRWVADAELDALAASIKSGGLRHATSMNLSASFNNGPAMQAAIEALSATENASTDGDAASETSVVPALAVLNLAGLDLDISHAALAMPQMPALTTVDLTGNAMQPENADLLAVALSACPQLLTLTLSMCEPDAFESLLQVLPAAEDGGGEDGGDEVGSADGELGGTPPLPPPPPPAGSDAPDALPPAPAATTAGSTERRLAIRVHVFLSEHRAENLHLLVDNATSQRQRPKALREALKSYSSRLSGEPKNRASVAAWREHCGAIAGRLVDENTSYRALHRLFQNRDGFYVDTVPQTWRDMADDYDPIKWAAPVKTTAEQKSAGVGDGDGSGGTGGARGY